MDKMATEISCKLMRETASAYLIDDGFRQVWLPKSQTVWDMQNEAKQVGIMSMPEWLAKDKELI